jgi:hypothetical protein
MSDHVAPTPQALPCPRIHVLLMIVLLVVTFGLYQPIWALKRAKELNALPGAERVGLWPIYYLLVDAVVAIPLSVLELPRQYDSLLMLNSLVYALLLLWVAVGIRRNLAAQGLRTSIGFTFLFNIFYLQYAINRHPSEGERPAVAA